MVNFWLERDRQAYRSFVRACIKVFYNRRMALHSSVSVPSSKKLINAIEAYAKGEKVDYKKEYDLAYKTKVVREEWYRIARFHII
jgi:hypothetical protein